MERMLPLDLQYSSVTVQLFQELTNGLERWREYVTALTALPEDLALVPNMVVYNHL